jgi:hypothetical protein
MRVADGQIQTHDSPIADADHRGVVEPQVGKHRVSVVGAGLVVVGAEFVDPRGPAEAAQIERDHLVATLPEPVTERTHHPVVQRQRRKGAVVQHQHRRTPTVGRVVQTCPCSLCESLEHTLIGSV